ncbi:MAG: VacB/RNase II family 3'-5' exoribonuclease [Planctomycetes bacterium]|nr:VacB/RNase II family 3'-5' exoribonuclease [Planctomycetota bacterium]
MTEPNQPERFAEETFERVKAFCTEPQTIESIAGELGVEESHELTEWLESLVFSGRLQRIKGKRYQAISGRAAVGMYRRSKGYGKQGGLVAPRDYSIGIIDIPTGLEEGAQDGDLVLASYKEGRGGRLDREGNPRLSGRVLNIIDSRPTEAVGILEYSHSGKARVRLEGYNLPRYAYIQPHEVHHTKPGTVVRVKLHRRADSQGRTRGELLGSIGSIDDPTHDLDNLIALFGFPGDFDPDALREAQALPQHPNVEEFEGRVDFRELPIITIDPKDAEDHDDAISIEKLDGGLIRLGVHIADVSHYISPDSALDQDARIRATSVYLPGKLIPMLPKELSAGLCSLHDSVDRLALSCIMTFNADGEMLRREIVKSVVRVRRYLTYEEVLPVLEGTGNTEDPIVDELLVEGRKLADQLQQRRMRRGALVLEIPRPHVIVDKAGLAVSVEPEHHDIAHNLIEEFMLICNEAVARFLLERGLPYIGRVHPAPSEDATEEFDEFCDELKVDPPDWETPGGVQKFLDAVKARPGFEAIHYALLRSMSRAVYHAGPDLHFALAVDKYVHFTSPIRRYPDTITHQILTEYLATDTKLRWDREPLELAWSDGGTEPAGKPRRDGKKIPDFERWEFSLPHIASHCTERSIRADKGELAADQIKVLRLLIPRIGEVMAGTVISVVSNAVVVQLDELMAEGYVEFSELSDGWVEMHKFWAHFETGAGVKKVVLGDRMEVEIANIDLGSRSLRLTPLGEFALQRNWSGNRAGNRERNDRRKRKSRGNKRNDHKKKRRNK